MTAPAMTRTEARLEVAREIVRRQVLGPDAPDALADAYLVACAVPALTRYDSGECVPTREAGAAAVAALTAA